MPADAVDEVAVIVGLLEAGKVSPEEAAQLLEALDASRHAAEAVEGTCAEVVATGDMELSEAPTRLDIEVPNSDITLQSVEGSEARVLVAASADAAHRISRNDVAKALQTTISGSLLALHAITQTIEPFRHLRVSVFLPRQATWTGTVRADNGPIRLHGLHCDEMHVETANGRVAGTGIVSSNLNVTTTNGGIELDGFRGRAALRTGNGAVTVRLGTEVLAGEDPFRLPDGVELDVTAVIGSGSFHMFLSSGVAADVTATTSGGHIEANGPVRQQVRLNRGTLRWRTPDWDDAARRIRLAVRTANGSIRIVYPND